MSNQPNQGGLATPQTLQIDDFAGLVGFEEYTAGASTGTNIGYSGRGGFDLEPTVSNTSEEIDLNSALYNGPPHHLRATQQTRDSRSLLNLPTSGNVRGTSAERDMTAAKHPGISSGSSNSGGGGGSIKSMWRSVGLGRSRGGSSAETSSTRSSGWSSRLTGSSRSRPGSQNSSPNPLHSPSTNDNSPVLPRSPSTNKLGNNSSSSSNGRQSTSNPYSIANSSSPSLIPNHTTSSKGNANKWLFEAQSATAGIGLGPGARKSSVVGLGLAAGSGAGGVGSVTDEGDFGGAGTVGPGPAIKVDDEDDDAVDGEGDDEDEEEEEEEEESEGTATWNSSVAGAAGRSRSNQYTHDLGKGLRPREFEEGDDVEDEDLELEGDREGEGEGEADGQREVMGDDVGDVTARLPAPIPLPIYSAPSILESNASLAAIDDGASSTTSPSFVSVIGAPSINESSPPLPSGALPLSTTNINPITNSNAASVSMDRTDSNNSISRPHREPSPDIVRVRSRSDGDLAFNLSGRNTSLTAGDQRRISESAVGMSLRPNDQVRPDYVVAVVGARNVGKTTVIRRGLNPISVDPPTPLFSDANGNRATSCKANYKTGGVKGMLQILEIDSGLLDYNSEGVVWPKDLVTPDSFMLCYDASDATAFDPFTSLLQAFWERGFDRPIVVLACKANSNPEKDAVDPNKVADMCNVYGAGIISLGGGVKDQKMKDAFKYVLMRMRETRGDPLRRPSTASVLSSFSAASSDHHPITAPSSRRGSTNSAHHVPFENPFNSIPIPARATNSRPPAPSSLGLEIVQEAPVGTSSTISAPVLAAALASTDQLPKVAEEEEELAQTLETFKVVSDIHPELLSEEGVNGEKSAEIPESTPKPESPTTAHSATLPSAEVVPPPGMVFPTADMVDNPDTFGRKGQTTTLDLHFSREDMIDKFLFAAVTGNDEQYVTLFLIVYRRFARPYDVVSKLIERFEFVAGRLKTDPLLSRFAQMKLCGVLTTWFHYYPGDFSAPSTLGLLQPFLGNLLPRGATWVAHYAAELIPLLSVVVTMPDPESSWALPDKPSEQQPPEYIRRPSLAPSYESTNSSLEAGGSTHSLDAKMDANRSRISIAGIPETHMSPASKVDEIRHRSNSDADSTNDRNSGSTSSMRRARIDNDRILADLSNALMELPEEVIAQQITRLAWSAFADMTPRDLIRHVLAPRDLKNPRAIHRNNDSNVMQSINFVNYLSDWVATMVLIQSKLKWRARVLEKFIAVASALRKMDNFDSLMGVLAGINCQPIWRLTETMETISLKLEGDRTKLPKRLRSLNKLMAKTKSFAAYRMALATSGADMLPYLGVHLQEITLTNEVKSDMRDGKVNWTKFSQMGRSAAIVLDCSRHTPTFQRDPQVERCIKDVPLMSTERQYELSYEYQPRQASVGSSRIKFRRLVGKVGDSLVGA